mmetsp:Transcript_9372/g.36579  ORF Transcript_9372/g.36579 Transcript_9372/m.36579 type:complete len:315 (+) Transcript_9372:780-1724(+)
MRPAATLGCAPARIAPTTSPSGRAVASPPASCAHASSTSAARSLARSPARPASPAVRATRIESRPHAPAAASAEPTPAVVPRPPLVVPASVAPSDAPTGTAEPRSASSSSWLLTAPLRSASNHEKSWASSRPGMGKPSLRRPVASSSWLRAPSPELSMAAKDACTRSTPLGPNRAASRSRSDRIASRTDSSDPAPIRSRPALRGARRCREWSMPPSCSGTPSSIGAENLFERACGLDPVADVIGKAPSAARCEYMVMGGAAKPPAGRAASTSSSVMFARGFARPAAASSSTSREPGGMGTPSLVFMTRRPRSCL